MGQPLRKPFEWKGSLWVCVSRRGDNGAQAYRLTHPRAFTGVALTYRAKTADGEAARSDNALGVECNSLPPVPR